METEPKTRKTKASDEMIDDAVAKKKKKKVRIREIVKVDMSDALFAMTNEEIRQSLSDWFDACDTELRKQRFGYGYRVVNRFIKNSELIVSCADYYRYKEASLYERDKTLCEGVCNLHILHIVARQWSSQPNVYHGSCEIQALLHVLKCAMLRKENATELFVRLLDLAGTYTEEVQKKLSEDSVDPLWVHNMDRIPVNLQAGVALFFYPNLRFLYKEPFSDEYILACGGIKDGVESFADALQQIHPDEFTLLSDAYTWSHMGAALTALVHAIEICEKTLQQRWQPLHFNKKPLVLEEATTYVAYY